MYAQPSAKHRVATGFSATTTNIVTAYQGSGFGFVSPLSTRTASAKTKGQTGDNVQSTSSENGLSQSISPVCETTDFSTSSRNLSTFLTYAHSDGTSGQTNTGFSTTSMDREANVTQTTSFVEANGNSFITFSATDDNEIGESEGVFNSGSGNVIESSTYFEGYASTGLTIGFTMNQGGRSENQAKNKTAGNSEDGYQFENLTQTTVFNGATVNDQTRETIKNGTELVIGSTRSFFTNATRSSGGTPASRFPANETDYDSDDPNNGAATPTTGAYNIPSITHKTLLDTTTSENFDVFYTDTETVSTRLNYTVSTTGETSPTTTSSTSFRTTNTATPVWTHPFEPFHITQTVETYLTETSQVETFFETTTLTSTISGPGAFVSGGSVLKNSVVVGNMATEKSLFNPANSGSFFTYTTDGQSGGAIRSVDVRTTTTRDSVYTVLSTSLSAYDVESSSIETFVNSSFQFGNISNAMAVGSAFTRERRESITGLNTNSNRSKALIETENQSARLQATETGTHYIFTEATFTFLGSEGFTFYTQTESTTSDGSYTTTRSQATMVEDGNTIVRSRVTIPNVTYSSAATLKFPVRFAESHYASEYGRVTENTEDNLLSGKVYTRDKDPLFGGYQKQYTNVVSNAGVKYRNISIVDHIITTTQIANPGVASIPLTINSAESSSYVSSFNFPFLTLKLNSYFTFIPETSYGNIYTSVNRGSASFNHFENDLSRIRYKHSKTYLVTAQNIGASATQDIEVTSTDVSLLDGAVKVGAAVAFAGASKTTFSQQNPFFNEKHAIGGKAFTNDPGFSMIEGVPHNSYLFDSIGSTVISGDPQSIDDNTGGTVTTSLPTSVMIFRNLNTFVTADTFQGDKFYQRCAADYRSTI